MNLFDKRYLVDQWDYVIPSLDEPEDKPEPEVEPEAPKRCLACFFAPCRCRVGLRDKK